jgi:hypothetical protein
VTLDGDLKANTNAFKIVEFTHALTYVRALVRMGGHFVYTPEMKVSKVAHNMFNV